MKHPKRSMYFLLPILLGSIIGLGIGFLALTYLLKRYFFQIISLFAGLMLGSFPTILKEIKTEKKTISSFLVLLLGLIIPILFSLCSLYQSGEAKQLESNLFWMPIIGLLISSTQLIPGLSATALLMMLGYFQPLFNALSLSNIINNPTIFLVFSFLLIGFLAGLIIFSKWIQIIFAKTGKKAYFLFVGLSFSSIIIMFYNVEMINWFKQSFVWMDLYLGILFFLLGTAIGYLFYLLELERLK